VEDKDNKSFFEAVDPRETQASTIGNRFGFQGLPVDPETGLVYFRNRYYDPEMGRFVSADPKGYVDGPSMYAFEKGDPEDGRDPLGLFDPGSLAGALATAETAGATTATAGTGTSALTSFCAMAPPMCPVLVGFGSYTVTRKISSGVKIFGRTTDDRISSGLTHLSLTDKEEKDSEIQENQYLPRSGGLVHNPSQSVFGANGRSLDGCQVLMRGVLRSGCLIKTNRLFLRVDRGICPEVRPIRMRGLQMRLIRINAVPFRIKST